MHLYKRFEGYSIGGSDPETEIFQSGPIFLVTHRFRNYLRAWPMRGYVNAKEWEAKVLAGPLPQIKPMGNERYPREYPLDIDWTRIRPR